MPVSQNRVFKTSFVSLKKYGNLGEKNLVNGLRQISQKVEILYSHLFLHIHGLLSHVPRIVWDFLFRRGHIDTEVDQIWVGVKTNFWWFCCNYNKEFYEKIPWLRPIVSDLDQEQNCMRTNSPRLRQSLTQRKVKVTFRPRKSPWNILHFPKPSSELPKPSRNDCLQTSKQLWFCKHFAMTQKLPWNEFWKCGSSQSSKD